MTFFTNALNTCYDSRAQCLARFAEQLNAHEVIEALFASFADFFNTVFTVTKSLGKSLGHGISSDVYAFLCLT